MGPKGTCLVVNALHKWPITIFWKATVASNSRNRIMIVAKSLYIVTGNGVIGYFWVATNSVNATGTNTDKKASGNIFFSIVSENPAASNFKIQHHVRHTCSLIVSQLLGFLSL